MGNLFVQNGTEYKFIVTQDGSPTLVVSQVLDVNGKKEPMHNEKGAMSETLFIYENVLCEGLKRVCHPRVVSVGLGCGYNEWMSLCFLKKLDLDINDIQLVSFESDKLILDNFQNWLFDKPPGSEPALRFYRLFNEVIELMTHHYQLPVIDVKKFGRSLADKKKWDFPGSLSPDSRFIERFGIVYYDAYSSKTSPELWTEEFFEIFFARACAASCAFATYASTGALKRALFSAGFTVEKQIGFAGKRESTLAFRKGI